MMEASEITILDEWVDKVASLVNPEKIYFCNGSREEYESITESMVKEKKLIRLNKETYPNCFLFRSSINDVARTEKSTFICGDSKSQVGPLNNFMSVAEAEKITTKLLKNSMKGKTMYVVPYIMGPANSPFAETGIEITDSPYVVANMFIMTRMGEVALNKIRGEARFVKSIHCSKDLNPEERYILHFPWKKTDIESDIISINSAYGGNALLSKKCHALRIASVNAKEQGWLAEHMLILEVESPSGDMHYIAAAFPSASGKTNLAMIKPPKEYIKNGWKTRLIGDDIAWMRIGKDGRLYAINPENGFFGVVPGTSHHTNPNAMEAIREDTIFTNVGLTEHNEPWWEGLEMPEGSLKDWQGNDFERRSGQKVAHPNSRFTTPLHRYPELSQKADDPMGVPISAIIFGGRRVNTIPLVFESFHWNHGVFLGATMGVEQTAAAEGKVGVVRRDPMAMRPFCGYNINQYFKHWIEIGKRSKKLPKIFYVNWFRKDSEGNFLWPGFGENMRVLEWIIKRCDMKIEANSTEIGLVPKPGEINLNGTEVSSERMAMVTSVNRHEWADEVAQIEDYLKSLGDGIPDEIRKEFEELSIRLSR
ncbi:MAG: phosphoenolpyruvate carboxykinase (GTP) [Candidatus Thermoplasmatota archaeon]|nr:phosphoenolpyruvate carboxykinase (GTP) [Candidatus Thermoplasmatota archaeon]